MKKNKSMPLGLTAAGLATGAIWTAVAGTFWQWIPIGAAIAVVYGVSVAVETKAKGGESPGQKKRRGKQCC